MKLCIKKLTSTTVTAMAVLMMIVASVPQASASNLCTNIQRANLTKTNYTATVTILYADLTLGTVVVPLPMNSPILAPIAIPPSGATGTTLACIVSALVVPTNTTCFAPNTCALGASGHFVSVQQCGVGIF